MVLSQSVLEYFVHRQTLRHTDTTRQTDTFEYSIVEMMISQL